MKPYKQSLAENTKRDTKGMHITTAAYHGSIWKPKWDNKVKLETHFRPVGPTTDDMREFLPWRMSGEPNEFGPWICSVPVFTGGTFSTHTFIPAYEDPNHPGDVLDTTIYPTPASEFIDNARTLAFQDKTGHLKSMLLDGGSGRAAALPKRITSVGLMQGILLRVGEKDYYTKPQMPCMLMLSQSACIALNERLNQEVEGYRGNPEDYNARFACGDVIGVNTGRILSFYNGAAKSTGAADAVNVDWNNAGNGAAKPKTQQDLAHYACDILSALPLPRLPDGRIKHAVEQELFVPWEQAIRFLDEQEMIDVLVSAYTDLPGLVLQCLRRYHDKLPNFVKGNATVQAMGPIGGSPAPVAPAAPAWGGGIAAAPVNAPVTAPVVAQVNWDNAGNTTTPESNIAPEQLYDAAAAAPAPAAGMPPAVVDNKVAEAMAKLNALRQAKAGAR